MRVSQADVASAKALGWQQALCGRVGAAQEGGTGCTLLRVYPESQADTTVQKMAIPSPSLGVGRGQLTNTWLSRCMGDLGRGSLLSDDYNKALPSQLLVCGSRVSCTHICKNEG